MKKIPRFLLALAAGVAWPLTAAEMLRFTPLLDLDGRIVPLEQNDARRVRVFVFLSTECPIARSYVPELNRLASSLKESSSAGVLDGHDVICIAATSAGRIVSATLQPGTRVPAYCTANGRVLVVALPQDEGEAWVARQSLVALTPNTITGHDRLRSEIKRARQQGYALVDQELEAGLRTIAVPLRNAAGEVVAAMNVSVHAASVSAERLIEVCLPALRHTQASLRALL